MTIQDTDYNIRRAEAEQRRAELAAGPEAARAHEQLAELHRHRAGQARAPTAG